QTVGGHRYRVRSVENVLAEVKWIRDNMPEVEDADLHRAGPIGRQPRRARLGAPRAGAFARQGTDSRLSKWVPTHLFTWRHRSAKDPA
ncbi:hypothetical protein, partial [Burkholderia gladioli]|uniref:hypothetical protein n=1 Tax=Burkholderia gladioli TaxID=28095 RepID=UPI00236450A4